MDKLKQSIREKWEKLLFWLAMLAMVVVLFVWLDPFRQEEGGTGTSGNPPVQASFLNGSAAFAFREEFIAPKIHDPHLFFCVVKPRARKSDVVRPWERLVTGGQRTPKRQWEEVAKTRDPKAPALRPDGVGKVQKPRVPRWQDFLAIRDKKTTPVKPDPLKPDPPTVVTTTPVDPPVDPVKPTPTDPVDPPAVVTTDPGDGTPADPPKPDKPPRILTIGYQGLMSTETGTRLALIKDRTSGKTRFLAEGKDFDGVTIKSFTREKLVVEYPEGTEVEIDFLDSQEFELQ